MLPMFMILLGLQTQSLFMILKDPHLALIYIFYKPDVNVENWKRLQNDSVGLMDF